MARHADRSSLDKLLCTCTHFLMTQGNGMGYGWVSYGFGLAFFFPLLCLSYISAHVNPATCLALWIMGDLGPGDFFALAASEFAGMFVAACLMWVSCMPLPFLLVENFRMILTLHRVCLAMLGLWTVFQWRILLAQNLAAWLSKHVVYAVCQVLRSLTSLPSRL